MLRRLVLRRLDADERPPGGVSIECLRRVARTAFPAFPKFPLLTPTAGLRKTLPAKTKTNPRHSARACRALASLLLLAAQAHALTPSRASAQEARATAVAWRRQEAGGVGPSRQLSSDGAMQGVDVRRTRAFKTRALREPKSLERRSKKLFELKESRLSRVDPRLGLSPGFWYSAYEQHFTVPVVAGDKVLFTVSAGDGYLLALDKVTGEVLWRTRFERDPVSPPAVAGDVAYVGSDAGTFYALDAATGRELWKSGDKARAGFVSPPAVHEGLAYFSVTRSVIPARPFGSPVPQHEGHVYALDARTGADVWRFDAKFSVTSPVIADGALYVGGDRLLALDAKTGRERWSVKVKGGVYTMAAGAGTIYFSDGDDVPNAVAAADGTPAWKAEKKFKTRTQFALGDGALYFGGMKHDVHALDAATGREKWLFKTEQPCGAPSLAEDFVYFSCGGEVVYALDAATGQERWKFRLEKATTAAPVLSDGLLYLLRSDGFLYALR